MAEKPISLVFDAPSNTWVGTADMRDGDKEILITQDSSRDNALSQINEFISGQPNQEEFYLTEDEPRPTDPDDDFTKWFGRGAVSDNEGPLTVYHGTTQGDENTGEVIENFLAMNKSWGGSHLGDIGEWFSQSPEVASEFAKSSGPLPTGTHVGGHVFPVHLNLQRPKVYDTYEDLEEEFNKFFEGPDNATKSAADFSESLIEQGYDGIEVENSFTDVLESRRDFVAFQPEQIRSVFEKSQEPRPTDPSVLEKGIMAADISSKVADEIRSLKKPPPGQELVKQDKRTGKGQMFRGLGSLMKRRVFPLVAMAKTFWGEIPESVKDDAGEIVDWLRENKMHELVGLDKPGLEYFKEALGLAPQGPTDPIAMEGSNLPEIAPEGVRSTSTVGRETLEHEPTIKNIREAIGESNPQRKTVHIVQDKRNPRSWDVVVVHPSGKMEGTIVRASLRRELAEGKSDLKGSIAADDAAPSDMEKFGQIVALNTKADFSPDNIHLNHEPGVGEEKPLSKPTDPSESDLRALMDKIETSGRALDTAKENYPALAVYTSITRDEGGDPELIRRAEDLIDEITSPKYRKAKGGLVDKPLYEQPRMVG